MTTVQAQDQWLIRTQKNVIAGPVPKEQVLELINNGRLGPQDEVCKAGAYWFYLHEEPEVFGQLGIHAPRLPSSGDEEEITQTQTRSHPAFPELMEPSGGFDPDRTGIVTNSKRQEPSPETTQVPSRVLFQNNRDSVRKEGEKIRRSAPEVVGSREPKINARVATFKTILLIVTLAGVARIFWTYLD